MFAIYMILPSTSHKIIKIDFISNSYLFNPQIKHFYSISNYSFFKSSLFLPNPEIIKPKIIFNKIAFTIKKKNVDHID